MGLYLVLAAIGFAGGILTGLLGIGSGIIYVLILPYALRHHGVTEDVITQYTISNSFFGMAVASLSASIANFLHKDVHWRESLTVSVPGVFLSVLLLELVVVKSWYSYTLFSILLIVFLLFILVSYHMGQKRELTRDRLPSKVLVFSGLAAGGLSALSGLGGGGILIPILSFRYHMDIKKAKSISLIMIFMVSFTLTLFTLLETPGKTFTGLQAGYILFPVALPLSLGVVLGSPAGVKLGHYLSSKTLSLIFSLVILIVIVEKVLNLAGI